MDCGSSILACCSVGLELVTQYVLCAIELTHVIHTALEERSRIYHSQALSEKEKVLTIILKSMVRNINVKLLNLLMKLLLFYGNKRKLRMLLKNPIKRPPTDSRSIELCQSQSM